MTVIKAFTPPLISSHAAIKPSAATSAVSPKQETIGSSLLTPPSSTLTGNRSATLVPITNLPPLQPTTVEPANNWFTLDSLHHLDANPLAIHVFACATTLPTPTGYIFPSTTSTEPLNTPCACCGWLFPRNRKQPYWGCEVKGCEMKRCEECMVHCGFFNDKCGVLCSRYFMSYEYGRGWENDDDEGGRVRVLKAGGRKWR